MCGEARPLSPQSESFPWTQGSVVTWPWNSAGSVHSAFVCYFLERVKDRFSPVSRRGEDVVPVSVCCEGWGTGWGPGTNGRLDPQPREAPPAGAELAGPAVFGGLRARLPASRVPARGPFPEQNRDFCLVGEGQCQLHPHTRQNASHRSGIAV